MTPKVKARTGKHGWYFFVRQSLPVLPFFVFCVAANEKQNNKSGAVATYSLKLVDRTVLSECEGFSSEAKTLLFIDSFERPGQSYGMIFWFCVRRLLPSLLSVDSFSHYSN